MNDYKAALYNSYRTSFKGETSEESLQFGASKLRPVIEPWVRDLDPSTPIFDLGCGAGELLRAFRDLGFSNLGGCDLSEEQTSIARQSFPAVETADCFAFLSAIPDGTIGLVTAFDLIEHLGPQVSFDLMRLIHQKLRPGGRVIIHLPNGQSPFVGPVFWGDMTHEWCLTPQSAKTFCVVNGFENFECVEHLGAGSGCRGAVRSLLWLVTRKLFQLCNLIETGTYGGQVWTRNFVFTTVKPLAK